MCPGWCHPPLASRSQALELPELVAWQSLSGFWLNPEKKAAFGISCALLTHPEQGFASPLLPGASPGKARPHRIFIQNIYTEYLYPTTAGIILWWRGGSAPIHNEDFPQKIPAQIWERSFKPIRDRNVQSRGWLCCCMGPSVQELEENLVLFTQKLQGIWLPPTLLELCPLRGSSTSWALRAASQHLPYHERDRGIK